MGESVKNLKQGSGAARSYLIESLEGRQMLSAAPPLDIGLQPGQGLIVQTSAGVQYTGNVATFSYSIGQGGVNATIDWGDGTQSSGGVINRGSSLPIEVVGSGHLYSRAGIYTTTISIFYPGQQSNPLSVVEGTADVSAAQIVGRLIFPKLNQQMTEDFGSFHPGPHPSETVLSANIDWGDGRSSVGVIRIASDGTYHAWGYHRYHENGYFHIIVGVYSSAPVVPLPPGTIPNPVLPITVATFLATAHVYNPPNNIVMPPDLFPLPVRLFQLDNLI